MTGQASHPGHRVHGVDATLAAIATLSAAWPISTLLAEPTWLRGTLLLLAVIAFSGIAARSLALRGWQVLLVQLGCLVLAASAFYGRDHLWLGLPTSASLRFANGLVQEAVTTAQANAAPAPATPGLIFVVGCALGLVALAVDYLAVTRRSPSLAGLPLLTVFLTVVANRGAALPLMYFIAVAAMWLILIARSGGALMRRWGTTVTVAHTPAPQGAGPRGTAYDYASVARMLGAGALATAVALPLVLPKPPPTFLASGLGRSTSSITNKSGAVGFSLSLDLAADLKSRSQAQVLEYTTSDRSPPPLRVAIGSYYRSEPGVWLPWGRPSPALSPRPEVPEPAGLSPSVPKTPATLNFRRNLLADPNLAAPYPLIDVDLAGIAWGSDFQTQTIRVAQRPVAYKASYWVLDPTPAMLRDSRPIPARDRYLFDLDLTLNGPYVRKVTSLTGQVTAGKTTPYDKAMAIQQYLRADGGFGYSLILAPPARDRTGKVAGFDSLTNFLVTKKGYCVQFATAMVMMSRASGIPARMVLGFLPGTAAKGVWTVLAADAHAWPELYLEGIGWTRFEPTPSRGVLPAYALPAALPATAADGQTLENQAAPTPGSRARKDLGDPSASGNNPQSNVALSPASMLRWLTHGWGPALIGSLLVLLGSLVVPAAAWWRRRRRLTAARTATEQVEVEWDLLTSSLSDLGIPPSPSRTPRQLRGYYEREAMLDTAASDALGRVVQTLERSRYAMPAPPPGPISGDARRVLRSASASRRGRDRLRAALWPSSGLTELRSARAHFGWRYRALRRSLGDAVLRRLPGGRAGLSSPAEPR
jgi:transglutaminase-like putative cysteine protease